MNLTEEKETEVKPEELEVNIGSRLMRRQSKKAVKGRFRRGEAAGEAEGGRR